MITDYIMIALAVASLIIEIIALYNDTKKEITAPLPHKAIIL